MQYWLTTHKPKTILSIKGTNNFGKKHTRNMIPRIGILLILSLYLFAGISSQSNEYDATIRTMEEFSGYQIHEPTFHDSSSSSLSVDTETLQRQVFLLEISMKNAQFCNST